jgi:hypothetical protein
MAKTSRIPYQPVEDIPNLDKAVLDALEVDPQMRDLLNSTRYALKSPSNLKKPSHYKEYIADLLINQLYMFSITHASIRELIAAADKYKQYYIVADALSLAREQVEKIYIIASLLDKPNQNFRQYLRSSWKVEYEKFLLDNEEHKENERFKKHLKKTLPQRLERMRRNQFIKGRKDILVSKFAIRVLKFNWNNPGEKKAPFLKDKTVYNYVKEYFGFATPGSSAAKITDPELRRFLYRWHKEYVALSQFTHITMRKLAFARMLTEKSMGEQEKIERFGIENAIRAIHSSYTAAATACVLVLNEVSSDYGAKAELRQFWDQLIGFSLFSKALWKMYIKDVI